MKSVAENSDSRPFNRVFHINSASYGFHATISIPIETRDDSGAFHALEHLIVTSANLIEAQKSLHVEHFVAQTSPTSVTFSYSSACARCFNSFSEIIFPAIFMSGFCQEDFDREIYRTFDDQGKSPGVVISEMESTLSRPRRQAVLAIRKHCFPDAPYGFNSGGDPKKLLQLTMDDLTALYLRYFSPCLASLYIVKPHGCADVLSQFSRLTNRDHARKNTGPSFASMPTTPPCEYGSSESERTVRVTTDNPDEPPTLVMSWLLPGHNTFYLRTRLVLFCRYLLTAPTVGLMARLRKVQGVLSLGEFNLLERNFPTPLLLISLRSAVLGYSQFSQEVRQALVDFVDHEPDEQLLSSLASSYSVEAIDVSLSAEPAGFSILQQLRTHIELGFSLEDIHTLDSAIQQSVVDLCEPAVFGRLVRSLLLDNTCLVQTRLVPEQRTIPLATSSTIPYHDVLLPYELTSTSAECDAGVTTIISIERLGGLKFRAQQRTNGIIYSFKIRSIAAKTDQALLDFLPFFSKYLTDWQSLLHDQRAPHASRAKPSLPVFNNTFFRQHSLIENACFVYNQSYSRSTNPAEAEYDVLQYVHDVHSTFPIRRLTTSSLKTFAKERYGALHQHAVALATTQAAKPHSLASLLKTRSTGLECFQWLKRQDIAEYLTEVAVTQLSQMWVSQPLIELDILDGEPAFFDCKSGNKSHHLDELNSVFSPCTLGQLTSCPIREFWIANVAHASASYSVPVKIKSQRQLRCLKIAEDLLSNSDMIRSLRFGGSCAPAVKLSVEDRSLHITSGTTRRPFADLEQIKRHLSEWLTSFDDEASYHACLRKLQARICPLPRIPDDALTALLGSAFDEEIITQSHTDDPVDFAEFKDIISMSLNPDTASIVVIADNSLRTSASSFGLNIREI